jgi:hypothetical protein
MKYVKCLYSTEELFKQHNLFTAPVHRVTHNVIYKIFSRENCNEDEFWIICDDGTKGRFRLNKTEEDVYFVDATQELREEKLNLLGI